MAATELNPDLRKLIDARLEAIDRVLAGSDVSWSERRSIVGEVETQIEELLARRGATPTQDDVFAVLGSLDPAESYLPEEHHLRAEHAPAARAQSNWTERTARVVTRFGSAALGVTGLVVANGIVVLIIASSERVIPWVVTLAGLAWLNVAAVRRFRAWSATRHGHLVDDVRHGLAAWLLPKNGAPAT